MNILDYLAASGLKPIYIDENTNIEEVIMGHSPTRETNVEFIVRIMEYGCPTGALIQPFIIEAIAKYAAHCAVEQIPENGLVDPEAWMETAQWVQTELGKKYGTS